MVLQAGRPKSGGCEVRWEPPSGLQMADFSLCPPMAEERRVSGASFTRALIPFVLVPLLGPNNLSKDSAPTTITLRGGNSTCEQGRGEYKYSGQTRMRERKGSTTETTGPEENHDFR